MMKTKLISPILFWFLALLGVNVFAQSRDSLATRFSTYHQKIVQEKIFLHLDKTSYLTGETLWLKVYCVEAASNIPLDLSKVAYVEISDRLGNAVVQIKVALENGRGSGSVFLPATLNSDHYTVTAYTNWMRNFPKEYFFNQPISIVNPFKKPDPEKQRIKNTSLDIQFFPEGGQLLAGVPSKVAFRVVNADGNGVSFQGEILDDNQNSVVTFKPGKFGLGTFTFTPKRETKYKAVITDANNIRHESSLPEIHSAGYSLSVRDAGENFEVNISAKDFDEPVVNLFVHAKNQAIFLGSSYIKNNQAQFLVPKSKMADGVTHLTIFDYKLNPVAERLLYIKPKTISSFSILTDASSYSERRKIHISLDLKQNTQSEKMDVSLSVSRKDSLSFFTQQNIEGYLKLTSDLHGQIESPEYYRTEASEEELNTLMLTHGWRRFSWRKILKPDYSYQWLPEIEGPILNGKIYDETGKPAKHIDTYLSSPSRKIQLYTSQSDTNGNLSYSLKNLFGSGKIYLQTRFSKDSLFDFKIEDPFVKQSATARLPALSLQKNSQHTLLSRSVAMQVQDIFNESENNVQPLTDTIPFYGQPDERYFLDDFSRFPVMEEVMREYVKGVWVRKRQNEFYFLVLDNINKVVFNENPLILLDGIPVWRVNDIMSVNPLKIKKIEVLTRKIYHGRISYSGIASFSTYTNDLAGIKMDRRNFVIDYDGLQRQRTFFSPVYETERQRSNPLPDQRNVLLWMPVIQLTNGKVEIDCYTSDVTGQYEINIQGIGDTGTPVSAHHTFTVSDYNN
jgi:hypothetical protein